MICLSIIIEEAIEDLKKLKKEIPTWEENDEI